MRSIRIYLLILVLGALLPGTLVTGVLVWRAFAGDRQATERRLIDSARVDAQSLDREFRTNISILQALATSPTLDRGNLEGFYDESRRVQATQSGWYAVMLLSADSQQLWSTRLPYGTPPRWPVENESLQQVFRTRQPVVGVVRPAPDGELGHLFAIRVPVIREGQLRYALSAVISVDSLARVIPRQTASSEEWSRNVLDSSGTIAVRTRGAGDYVGRQASEAFRERVRTSEETFSSETTREGDLVYAAASRGAYGWTAVIVVPRSVLDAPVRASMTGLLTGGAVLMICGLAAVLVISRRLASDLAAATAAADAVAAGRPVPKTDAHVAETYRLQQSLATAASLLENRARERDEQIRRADAARGEAEEANQTKDRFLAVLGHELRNPLAPALTALEIMKRREPVTFAREREILERQIKHMARLVSDLLDISHLARGRVELHGERFEVRDAVERATDMAAPLLAARRHQLDVTVPAQGLAIDADLDRIVQVLSNLVTNAAKYTPPGGHIAVSAFASGSRVVIACEDDGPGVPPNLMSTLFDPFAQGPRTIDRKEGGLGLGLALARTFTELHGGTIHVESRGDLPGSRFVITLPLAPGVADVPLEVAPVAATRPARRILVVDDNVDACEMLRHSLDHFGHTVATANNGPEGIATAKVFQPQVAILDIGLPGMDGYELARRLREAHPTIRLIALTGYGQVGDVAAATAAGFDDHRVKPVTGTALLELIDANVARASVNPR